MNSPSLAELAIEAHGGLDRWRRFKTVSARLLNGGALWPLKHHGGVLDDVGVPTASGQKTTLSHYGIGPSQRAKAFAMEFPFNVEAILTVGIDVRVARRRQMHHITIIDVMVFRLELI
jgi:hypothetical protein